MRLVAWVARAALFLLLFGLALNNLHDVEVHGLFGVTWRAPMIVVVLAAFTAGAVLALVALWPRHLQQPRRDEPPPVSVADNTASANPPRDGS
jgi:putative membrane protein